MGAEISGATCGKWGMRIGMARIPDLWPDSFGQTEITAPSAILKAQAAALSTKTGGVLEGRMVSHAIRQRMKHSLYVVAPPLHGYQYKLLTIEHGIEMYPVEVMAGGETFEANDQENLVEVLRRELSSARTTRVIQALLAQSRDADSFRQDDDDDVPF